MIHTYRVPVIGTVYIRADSPEDAQDAAYRGLASVDGTPLPNPVATMVVDSLGTAEGEIEEVAQ